MVRMVNLVLYPALAFFGFLVSLGNTGHAFSAARIPVLVKDINPAGSSTPLFLTNINGILFFSANDGVHGYELWCSDGTDAGTYMVKDLNPSGGSYPTNLINVNGILFFKADDGAHGNEIWRSDGTTAGTRMLRDINPLYGSSPEHLTIVNGTLFFSADDGARGRELWRLAGAPLPSCYFWLIN